MTTEKKELTDLEKSEKQFVEQEQQQVTRDLQQVYWTVFNIHRRSSTLDLSSILTQDMRLALTSTVNRLTALLNG